MPEQQQQQESEQHAAESQAFLVGDNATPVQIHQLVVRCAGHPAKLAHLLRGASASVTKLLIGEGQRLFGNQVVQEALKILARENSGHHDDAGGGSSG
jgi:hypothetical protein